MNRNISHIYHAIVSFFPDEKREIYTTNNKFRVKIDLPSKDKYILEYAIYNKSIEFTRSFII